MSRDNTEQDNKTHEENDESLLLLVYKDKCGRMRTFDADSGKWLLWNVAPDDRHYLEDAAFCNFVDEAFVFEKTSETFSLPVVKATRVTRENDKEANDDAH